ncbi:MAG: hypothetical protein ABJ251_17400 [Paracoccaceae bacterium]
MSSFPAQSRLPTVNLDAAIASRFADIGFRDQCFYHLTHAERGIQMEREANLVISNASQSIV